jgi:hypothetical protein
MRFCSVGNHVISGDFCTEHPPQRDRPRAGRCDWGKGHDSPAVWLTPRDGKSWCSEHLARIVKTASWGWKR